MKRKILITHWAGEAWKAFIEEPEYLKNRSLLPVDGSDDHLVAPEDLPDYEVPPISILNSSQNPPTSNSLYC